MPEFTLGPPGYEPSCWFNNRFYFIRSVRFDPDCVWLRLDADLENDLWVSATDEKLSWEFNRKDEDGE